MMKRLWALVQPEARRDFLIISAFDATSGLIELLGITTVAEFMGISANKGRPLQDFGLLSFCLKSAGIETPERSMGVALALTVVVLGLVQGFKALRTYARARFVWLQDREMSTRLFSATLQRPYPWFLDQNTGRLQHILSTSHVTKQMLDGVLGTLASSAMTLTLGAALLWTDPVVAVVGGVFLGVVYAIVRRWSDRLLTEKGGAAHLAEKERRRLTVESLVGIRFVKTTAKEEFFVRRYREQADRATQGMVFHQIYTNVVRAILEWVAFTGLLGLCVHLVLNSADVPQLLPRLTLYSMVGYRIIPSLHDFFQHWTRLRFHSSYLVEIEQLLALPTVEDSARSAKVEGLDTCQHLLSFQGVSYSYPGSEREVLKGISLDLKPGEWVGVVGATGAGKTTLLDLISGLCFPTEGVIRVGESDLNEDVVSDWHDQLGVVPQEVLLLDDTLERNVAFAVDDAKIDTERVAHVCKMAGLSGFLERLEQGYQSQVGERGVRISGGERQRVGLARALYPSPRLLLLDEATSALDQPTEARIVETLEALRQECTLVTVAHRLSSVKPCDRILVLREGELVGEGTFQELLETNPYFQQLAMHRDL